MIEGNDCSDDDDEDSSKPISTKEKRLRAANIDVSTDNSVNDVVAVHPDYLAKLYMSTKSKKPKLMHCESSAGTSTSKYMPHSSNSLLISGTSSTSTGLLSISTSHDNAHMYSLQQGRSYARGSSVPCNNPDIFLEMANNSIVPLTTATVNSGRPLSSMPSEMLLSSSSVDNHRAAGSATGAAAASFQTGPVFSLSVPATTNYYALIGTGRAGHGRSVSSSSTRPSFAPKILGRGALVSSTTMTAKIGGIASVTEKDTSYCASTVNADSKLVMPEVEKSI